jgi:hypothetical protein
LALRQEHAREELVVFFFIKPGTLDVKEFQAGYADRERERVDRELRNRLVRARIRFVIEDMHGVVADLQKVEVAGDRARRPTRRELDPVSRFELGNLVFGEPDEFERVVYFESVTELGGCLLVGWWSRVGEMCAFLT